MTVHRVGKSWARQGQEDVAEAPHILAGQVTKNETQSRVSLSPPSLSNTALCSPPTSYVPKVPQLPKAELPARNQIFKCMSPWEAFHKQTITMTHFDMLLDSTPQPYSKDTFLNNFFIVYGRGPTRNT